MKNLNAPAGLALACAGVIASLAAPTHAIVWNGDRPDLGTVNPNGLRDRPGIFNNTHVFYDGYGYRGTATYVANGWVLSARHLVQGPQGYGGPLTAPGVGWLDVAGTRHYTDRYVEIPDLADEVLMHVVGDVNLPELKRSSVYNGFNDFALVQMGGYGGHGYFNQNPNFSVDFYRGYNTTFPDGGHLSTSTGGEDRLRQYGLLEAGAISGDSGSPLLLLQGKDSQWADQERYTIAGTLGASGGSGVGSYSIYSRTAPYANLIRDTIWGPEKTVNYTFNKPGTADLATVANWTPDQPGNSFPFKSGFVNVNNGGVVNFDAGSNGGRFFDIDATSDFGAELWAGQNGTGTINISGGSLGTGNYVVAGRGNGTGTINISGGTVASQNMVAGAFADGTGTINLSSGTVNLRNSLRVAEGGKGTLNQTGGTININFGGAVTNDYDRATIGQLAGSSGVYNLSGGTLNVKGDSPVDDVNNGLAGGLNVGERGKGVLNLSGSGRVNTRTLFVGRAGNGAGAVRQSGGVLSVTSVDGAQAVFDNRVGGISAADANAYGSYRMTGGVLGVTGNFQVGAYGLGTMDVAGGVASLTGYTAVGRYAGGEGVLNVSGGTLAQGGSGFVIVGEQGRGTLNVTGGTLDSAGKNLSVGHAVGGVGTLNLNGGVLRADRVLANSADATSLVNFGGGTLQATAGNVDLLSGMDRATINAGGAFIDTAGHDVTLSQALSAPDGRGVSGVTVTGGSGYVGAPLVRITGGGGTGATAVAVINPDTGAVTGVQITNPGTGYTSAPTVSLVGGGGTGATVGAAVLADNVGGGLTKSGLGTLTLTGTNTYSGSTRVALGDLLVDGSNTGGGTYLVESGANFGGNGSVTSSLVTIAGGGNLTVGTGGVGTFDVVGDVALDGTLRIDLDPAGSGRSDLLGVSGLLDLTGATLDLTALAPADDAAYVFADYGTLLGTFATVTGLTPGYTLDYAFGGSQIAVVAAVPEPAGMALIGLAGVALAARRRRSK